MSSALDELSHLVPELLCSQGMLEFIIRMEGLESLRAYTKRMEKPLNLVLDGDLVWPIPERLYPYD